VVLYEPFLQEEKCEHERHGDQERKNEGFPQISSQPDPGVVRVSQGGRAYGICESTRSLITMAILAFTLVVACCV
jgi:hypothetical protein